MAKKNECSYLHICVMNGEKDRLFGKGFRLKSKCVSNRYQVSIEAQFITNIFLLDTDVPTKLGPALTM